MKKLILPLFLLFFCACNDDNNSPSVVTPSGEKDAASYLQSLEIQEQQLQNQYIVSIEWRKGQYWLNIPDAVRVRYLAYRRGISVEQFVNNMNQSIYNFSLNYLTISRRYDELAAYNRNKTQDYYYKTKLLYERYSNGQGGQNGGNNDTTLKQLNSNLKQIGIDVLEILNTPDKKLYLPYVNSRVFRKTNLNNVRALFDRSIKLCKRLSQNTRPNTSRPSKGPGRHNNRACEQNDVAYFIFSLNLGSTNNQATQDHRSILSEIKNYSLRYLENLQDNASRYLNDNALILDTRSSAGIQENRRNSWERKIRNQYAGSYPPPYIEAAIQNNRYENLTYRKALVEATLTLTPNLSPAERRLHESVLNAIDRALRGVEYRSDIEVKVGTSPYTDFVPYPVSGKN